MHDAMLCHLNFTALSSLTFPSDGCCCSALRAGPLCRTSCSPSVHASIPLQVCPSHACSDQLPHAHNTVARQQ